LRSAATQHQAVAERKSLHLSLTAALPQPETPPWTGPFYVNCKRQRVSANVGEYYLKAEKRKIYGNCGWSTKTVSQDYFPVFHCLTSHLAQTGNRAESWSRTRGQLRCIRRVTSRTGNRRSTKETEFWQEERTARLDARGMLPVEFHVPVDARETDIRNRNNQIVGQLDVDAPMPGVKYAAWFEVPVFKVS
jgi:hypothetical protein